VHAFSGAAQVNGRIADEHGQRGDYFEIDERFDAQAADFPEVGMAGDAHHKNAEQQRRDDDFDEPQKNSAKKLQVDRDRGPIVAQLRAREKADENPSRQRTPRSCMRGDD